MLTYALVCCALGFLFVTKFPQPFTILGVDTCVKGNTEQNLLGVILFFSPKNTIFAIGSATLDARQSRKIKQKQ